MDFLPLGNRVTIKQDPEIKVTDGGLYLPDETVKKPSRGTVLRVGHLCYYDLPGEMVFPLKEGDRVQFSKYGGASVAMESAEDDILVIPMSDVFGILVDEPEEYLEKVRNGGDKGAFDVIDSAFAPLIEQEVVLA